MDITFIEQKNIDKIWHKVKGFAEDAAEYTYGRFTANDIRTNLKNNHQQLWIAHEGDEVYGFVVTEPTDYPQMKALIMHFTAGKEVLLWKDEMLKWIRAFAKEQGCEIIESYGRVGWSKVFKDDGFQKRFMFYELPVECKQ
jgi:hypothetical protein